MELGLIQWSNSPPELATWEPLATLRQQFPRAPAWGHAGSKAPGNVSSSSQAPGEEAPASGSPPSLPLTRPNRVRRPNSRVVAWINP
jgi:hypothetical protein